MKKVIILSLLATFTIAMKPESYKFAVLIEDSVEVHAETPKVNFSMKQLASEYEYAEVVDTLFVGDTVVVVELRRGIDYDAFVRVYYPAYDTIIKKRSCCSKEMDTIIKVREIKEGWIQEHWHDLYFIEYFEKEQEVLNDDGNGAMLLNLGLFLFGYNGEISVEGTVVHYHWLGVLMVALIIAEFILIFSKYGDKLFPALKKAKVSTRFKIWVVMVIADVVFIAGVKLSDILIIIRGRI